MTIQEIIKGKLEWRAHVKRVKALPSEYQIVYKEIEKYLFKVGPVELNQGLSLLSELLELFEEGAAFGKKVLDVTGNDVAAFCDELVKDSKTYEDMYQDSVDRKVYQAIKKSWEKNEKEGLK